jgi:hypothetical protein
MATTSKNTSTGTFDKNTSIGGTFNKNTSIGAVADNVQSENSANLNSAGQSNEDSSEGEAKSQAE